MRRLLAALVLGAALTAAPAGAAVPVLVVSGRGFGHGVGMAQDGALWMARSGSRTEQILSHFYPGTRLARKGGSVRVPVLDVPASSRTTLAFPNGGELRGAGGAGQSSGLPLAVPGGGRVRIGWDGQRYRAEVEGRGRALPAPQGPDTRGPAGGVRPASAGGAAQPVTSAPAATTTTAPQLVPSTLVPPLDSPAVPISTTTTGPPPAEGPGEDPGEAGDVGRAAWSSAPLVAVPAGGGTVSVPERDRRYRGEMNVVAGGGRLRLVNELDVEQYLRGMGEVRDPGWPPAALRAQAIAARTYALKAMAAGGEVCETQRCQVYLGAQAEYGAMDKAVEATRGQVLTYGRGLASAVYSANGGGVSATPEEGFGTDAGAYPYLRAAPYETRDPLPWTVRVALSDVGARFGYRGKVSGVRVGRLGPSGRVLEVVIEGSRGPKAVQGIAFDAGLGLRSTLFELRVEEAASAPPPPVADGPVQAPPGGGDELEDLAEEAEVRDPSSSLSLAGARSALDSGRAEPSPPPGLVLFAALVLAKLAARRAGRGRAELTAMGANE